VQSYPPVGKLVDVGGHRLHVHTTGQGSPTVVLEAGGGSWSLDWSLVQPEVARFTRVCSVIRHGMPDLFASMPADQARQAEQIWQELQADLAGLSSNSKLVVAEKGGHGIPVDQPALVVDAIRQVVETVRRASP
jgi:pimeloyl-ACP methyl ester carboxylesterase